MSPDSARIAEGEWSIPLTKPEIANRLTGAVVSRRRQPNVLSKYELRQFTDANGKPRPNLWLIRLDGLPDEVRARLTKP